MQNIIEYIINWYIMQHGVVCLSENYLPLKFIVQNILDTKYLRSTVYNFIAMS